MVCIVLTVKNEETTIIPLLDSVLSQSRRPDEVIICDGGSTDSTVSIIQSYEHTFKSAGIVCIVTQRAGNRSIGRNTAIHAAQSDIILVTDAGCILDTMWVKKMCAPFERNDNLMYVAGYYKGGVPPENGKNKQSLFQRCMVPYTCVMPDRLDESAFLPSSRSLGFRKRAWEEVGGYNESLSYAEDLEFARILRYQGYTSVMVKDALVHWEQRKDIKSAFRQFFEYARGDGIVRYFRPNVWLLFGRYTAGLLILGIYVYTKWTEVIYVLAVLSVAYLAWAIWKNYKYVGEVKALIYLPVIQLTADLAVMSGNMIGLIEGFKPARYALYQIVAKVFTAAMAVVITALLTRHLGSTLFSQYSYILAVGTFAFLFADLGLDMFVMRESTRKSAKAVVQDVISIRLALSSAVTLSLIIWAYRANLAGELVFGLVLVSIANTLLLLLNTLWALLKGKFRYAPVVKAQLITSSVTFACVLAGTFFKFGLVYFLAVSGIGIFAGLIHTLAYYKGTKRLIPTVSKRSYRLLKKTLAFSSLYILGIAYFKVDILILGHYYPPQQSNAVGLYALGYKPFEIMILLGNYYADSLLPYFNQVKNASVRQTLKTFVPAVIFGGISLIAMWSTAHIYTQVVGGSDYMDSVRIIQTLSVAALTTIVSGCLISYLVAKGQERKLVVLYAIVLMTNIILNFLMIPQYSYIGASVATVVTQAFLLVGAAIIFIQFERSRHSNVIS